MERSGDWVPKLALTVCPKPITLQHLILEQIILGAVTERLHHRNFSGIICRRRNSYRRFKWSLQRNVWRLGPLGELISGTITYFVHLGIQNRLVPSQFGTDGKREERARNYPDWRNKIWFIQRRVWDLQHRSTERGFSDVFWSFRK